MNKAFRYFLGLLLFIACSDQSKSSLSQSDKAIVQPNIVFLFTDDQTYQAVHALGNEEIKTPNIDRLVHSGTTFTHAYNMGGWNGAICAASRAMMISGRSMWRANQFREYWKDNDEAALDQTWPRIMERHGYDTYMTGKWHVDAPADVIFGEARHIRPGMPPDAWRHSTIAKMSPDDYLNYKGDKAKLMPVGYNRPLSSEDKSWSPVDTSHGGFWEGGQHWSEVVRDDALSFIANAKGKEDPFFMYLAFNAPHDPRQAPPEYMDMYQAEDMTIPLNMLPEYPYKEAIGNGPTLRDEALAPYPRTPYAVQVHRKEYYAIISHLDTQVGKILDALEASGKLDNTYIFFAADHGLSVGQHGLIGKQSMYDHSMRVPLIVSGKNFPKGKKISTPVYLQDIMATSLDLADIAQPEYVEFNSLKDLATGAKKSQYQAIYGAYIDFQRMIRKGDYKLIVYPKINKMMLFNIAEDPNEMNDLSKLEHHKSRVEQMLAELQSLQREMDDPLDLDVL